LSLRQHGTSHFGFLVFALASAKTENRKKKEYHSAEG
jgi:hypothetical protein